MLEYLDIKFEVNEGLIEFIDDVVDIFFVEVFLKNGSFSILKELKENLKIVFIFFYGILIIMIF